MILGSIAIRWNCDLVSSTPSSSRLCSSSGSLAIVILPPTSCFLVYRKNMLNFCHALDRTLATSCLLYISWSPLVFSRACLHFLDRMSWVWRVWGRVVDILKVRVVTSFSSFSDWDWLKSSWCLSFLFYNNNININLKWYTSYVTPNR